MKSVACIGQGFVGGSLTTVLSERGFTVHVYDKAGKVAQGGNPILQVVPVTTTPARSLQLAGVSPHREVGEPTDVQKFVNACESQDGFSNVYFVCLPTPMYEDGTADVSIVAGVLNELASVDGKRVAVVKSTIPPGTTERWNELFKTTGLRIVFNPEFLTEANALDDMRNQDRIVLGGPRPWINSVRQIFQSAFPKVPVVKTSSTTAEMVKYVTNCFLATKVAFANEIAQVCEALDARGGNIDYDKVVEYARLDKRLGSSHWSVPGPDGSRGFGGHCFPKDVNAMLVVARGLGVEPTVMAAAWRKNLEVRTGDDRDWERMEGRAVSRPRELTLFWCKTPGKFVRASTGADVGVVVNGKMTFPNFTGDTNEWYETLILVIEDALAQSNDDLAVTVGPEAYAALAGSVLFQASTTPGMGHIVSTCKSGGFRVTLDASLDAWDVKGKKSRVLVVS